jgi:hypothetical protein
MENKRQKKKDKSEAKRRPLTKHVYQGSHGHSVGVKRLKAFKKEIGLMISIK